MTDQQEGWKLPLHIHTLSNKALQELKH